MADAQQSCGKAGQGIIGRSQVRGSGTGSTRCRWSAATDIVAHQILEKRNISVGDIEASLNCVFGPNCDGLEVGCPPVGGLIPGGGEAEEPRAPFALGSLTFFLPPFCGKLFVQLWTRAGSMTQVSAEQSEGAGGHAQFVICLHSAQDVTRAGCRS